MVLGEFLGVWAWGLFFCGMNGGRDERTGCRPAGSLSVLFFGGVRCGGLTGGWWIQWNEVLAVFVEGFLLTFDGGVVILKVHIWEHSGPFGYLIPIWLVV